MIIRMDHGNSLKEKNQIIFIGWNKISLIFPSNRFFFLVSKGMLLCCLKGRINPLNPVPTGIIPPRTTFSFKPFNQSIRPRRASYTISGIIGEVNKTTVRITELPVWKSTEEYKQFLDSIMKTSSKNNELFIKDFKDNSDHTNVNFEISLSEKTLSAAKEEGLLKKFKLTTTISTSNMHLFDTNGVLKKYKTPEEILEEFFHLRLEFYGKRKEALLNVLNSKLLKLENKVMFIEGVVDGEIIVTNRKRADLFFELKQKGFAQFQKKIAESGVSKGTEGNGENGYDYLLSIPIGTLTLEKVRELQAERDKLKGEIDDLKKATPMSLWVKDLDALEKELEGKYEAKVEEARIGMQSKVMKGSSAKVSREAPKNPRWSNAKKANNVETTPKPVIESATPAAEIGNVPETLKPKVRTKARKTPSEKPLVTSNDVGVLELNEQLAAHNSPPAHSTVKVVTVTEEVPTESKSSTGTPAEANNTVIQIPHSENGCVMVQRPSPIREEKTTEGDNIHVDEQFDCQIVSAVEWAMKGVAGSNPTTNATEIETTAETRKRATAIANNPPQRQLRSQKVKPVESTGVSPEKKVRRTSTSPFGKKSGSPQLDMKGGKNKETK